MRCLGEVVVRGGESFEGRGFVGVSCGDSGEGEAGLMWT